MAPEKQPTLRALLLRAARDSVSRAERLGMPGEGDEREFRKELIMQVLAGALGWAGDRIFQGERFDILLYDEQGREAINIETKSPSLRKWSAREERDFIERLGYYPTLQHAFITNGYIWHRFDLFNEGGQVRKVALEPLSIERGGAPLDARVDEYLAPLKRPTQPVPGRGQLGLDYFGSHPAAADQLGRPRRYVSPVHPGTIEALTQGLRTLVSRLEPVLADRLLEMSAGGLGERIAETTQAIFEDWCRQSLVVPPGKLIEQLGDAARRESIEDRRSAVLDALASLRRTGDAAPDDASILERVSTGRAPQASDRDLRTLYKPHVDRFCTQTAHTVLARVLLLRVGEDAGLWEQQIAGRPLRDRRGDGDEWALRLFESLRERFQRDIPTLYGLGFFDWWMVLVDKRATLTVRQEGVLRSIDRKLNMVVGDVLDVFDGYAFLDLRVDVWQQIYDRYLPKDERQRLGGFYTPPELVDLVLDAAGFSAPAPRLCERRMVDLSCGSGTFLVAAAARLRQHLERDMPCHATATVPGAPLRIGALRIAERIIDNILGVDIHPFAAALSTVNLVVQLLDLLIPIRRKDASYPLDPHVYVADALEPPQLQEEELSPHLNARIEVSLRSLQKLAKQLERPFDLIVGNPPWGGVLKGPLAPVYDDAYKRRLAQNFPVSTQGKYDVYGVFVERAWQLVREKGMVALVVQSTFLEKEWASELRGFLASQSTLRSFLDLSPLGQILFGAMNTPCVLVFDRDHLGQDQARVIRLLERPLLGRGGSVKQALAPVRQAWSSLDKKGKPPAGVSARRLKQEAIRSQGTGRWSLDDRSPVEAGRPRRNLLHVLQASQGVTPGGVLDLFLLQPAALEKAKLEKELVHRAVKSADIGAWSVQWRRRSLLYPYLPVDGQDRWAPAFQVSADGQRLERDALELSEAQDEHERELLHRGADSVAREKVLEYRIAKGMVRFPEVARYLRQHYDRLSERVFKKKNIRAFKRQWYEYLWPRDASVLLSRPALLVRGLIRRPSFCLLDKPYLSDHAVFFLTPTESGAQARTELMALLARNLGRKPSELDLLLYLLVIANHPKVFMLCTRGRQKTPKGSYQVSEEFLSEVPIPDPPRSKAKLQEALALAGQLVSGNEIETEELERRLSALVERWL